HQAARDHRWGIEPRHMQEINAALTQNHRQVKMRPERTGFSGVVEQVEILRQGVELLHVLALADQQVARRGVLAGQLVDYVTYVGADAEIAGAADVNRYAHRPPGVRNWRDVSRRDRACRPAPGNATGRAGIARPVQPPRRGCAARGPHLRYA